METIFEGSGQKNNLDKEHTDQKENYSEDPFDIYKMLNKKEVIVENEKNSGLITIQRKMSQVRYAQFALKSQRSERGGSMNFMSLNIQGLAQKAKKDWVKELCVKHKVNFLALQETKMKHMELFSVKMCWGNLVFDFVHSDSV
ncbi:RNA-directed DNA polymerase, eukaryota, partial [Tanacetum coccineum]